MGFLETHIRLLGLLCINLGHGSTIMAEFCRAMIAIEVATNKGWRNFWLEIDSKIVMLALSSSFLVPWCIRNKWIV